MKPAWLIEFHRQWHAARGERIQPSKTVFTRDWEILLEKAGINAAEDRKLAEDEARALATEGKLKLVLHRHRHLRRVQLLLDHEGWLQSLFGSANAADVLAQASRVLTEHRDHSHPRYGEAWAAMCDRIDASFALGKNLRPFFWRKPGALHAVLHLLRDLTAKDWPPFTLVRDASMQIGGDSKMIDRHHAVIEAALSELFDREMTLEGLGIVSTNSEVRFHGPLTLHFDDGSKQIFSSGLRHHSLLTAADIERATSIHTNASFILSVENRKTTFRHLVAANQGHRGLIITTSFPTRAVRSLLRKLPCELPHHHFGDTDAAGYKILFDLRKLGTRAVHSLEMDWQDQPSSPALREYDRRIIATLLAMPEMGDCHEYLLRMQAAGRRGRFEQEDRELATVLGKVRGLSLGSG